jgi:hypothetical protein
MPLRGPTRGCDAGVLPEAPACAWGGLILPVSATRLVGDPQHFGRFTPLTRPRALVLARRFELVGESGKKNGARPTPHAAAASRSGPKRSASEG